MKSKFKKVLSIYSALLLGMASSYACNCACSSNTTQIDTQPMATASTTQEVQEPQYIYKILTQEEWAETQTAGKHSGNAWDQEDGFIHLSTASQVERIAQKYYPNITDGVLLKINYANVKDSIKWEPSPSGTLYPHIYGDIANDAIAEVSQLDVSSFDFKALN